MGDDAVARDRARPEDLRARAERARQRARALIAKSLVLHARANQSVTHASSEILTARSLSDRLQAVVSQHADLSRSIGDTPEQAVLRMKEAAAEAVAMAKAKAGVVDPEEAQLLREQLVRWTVDAFFGTIH